VPLNVVTHRMTEDLLHRALCAHPIATFSALPSLDPQVDPELAGNGPGPIVGTPWTSVVSGHFTPARPRAGESRSISGNPPARPHGRCTPMRPPEYCHATAACGGITPDHAVTRRRGHGAPRHAAEEEGRMCAMRILVLGAGFGGLELSTRLSSQIRSGHRHRPHRSKRGVHFWLFEVGRDVRPKARFRGFSPYRDIDKPGLRFVQTTIRTIDPAHKRVETDSGTFEGDVMVVALGPTWTPPPRRVCSSGSRSSTPSPAPSHYAMSWRPSMVATSWWASPRRRFKCPPAPSETALLMHDYLTERGLRERHHSHW